MAIISPFIPKTKVEVPPPRPPVAWGGYGGIIPGYPSGAPSMPSLRFLMLKNKYPNLNSDDLTFLAELEEEGGVVPTMGNQTLDWIASNIASQHFSPQQYETWLSAPPFGGIPGTTIGKHTIGTLENYPDLAVTEKTQYTFPWDFYYLTQQQYQKVGQAPPAWLSSYLPTPERPFGKPQFSGADILAAQKAETERKRLEARAELERTAAEQARAMQLAPRRKGMPSTWAFAPPARWLTY